MHSMTALASLVEPLKRELAVPGTFEDVFPDTDDSDLAATLADAFSEAQLQGFFPDLTLGGEPDYETSVDLTAAASYLIVLFAGARVLRAWLRTLNSNERYKAGSTEFETARPSALLRDELAAITSKIDGLLETARRQRRGASSTVVLDNYWARQAMALGLGGYAPVELGR